MLGIVRSTLDYQPAAESAEDRKIKRLMDEIYLRDACLGTRRLVTVLERDHGLVVNRKRLQRLRREMGLETIYCRPRTSVRTGSMSNIPTCCGSWPSPGPTRSGAPTSPTCRCRTAMRSCAR